jgi:murein DD-endopeptidase MepM/ murein hydrolase activator NlpD
MFSFHLKAFVWLFLLMPARAAQAESSDEGSRLAQRLATRQAVLEGQKDGAAARVREQALLAYRLTRRRELGFMSSPQSRRDDAEAADLALTSLGKGLSETRALVDELGHVRAERVVLDRARSESVDPPPDPSRIPSAALPVLCAGPWWAHLASGVTAPRRTELRRDGIELLARLNEPVRAVAAGVVRRVESLPSGRVRRGDTTPGEMGQRLVWPARRVVVALGEPVEPGQVLGLAGRNLDGAAVISLELWRNRQPVDPRDVVPRLPRR